jgi:hypothetical protein
MNGISAKPEKEFKVGAVRAAVWSNLRHTSNGKMFNSHKVIVDRVYKDNHGDFKTTNSLDTNDIPKAILALKKAFEYLTLRGPEKTGAKQEALDDLEEPERIP